MAFIPNIILQTSQKVNLPFPLIPLQSVKIYFDFVLFSRKEDFGSVAEILFWG